VDVSTVGDVSEVSISPIMSPGLAFLPRGSSEIKTYTPKLTSHTHFDLEDGGSICLRNV
jgi:hypothetical protein